MSVFVFLVRLLHIKASFKKKKKKGGCLKREVLSCHGALSSSWSFMGGCCCIDLFFPSRSHGLDSCPDSVRNAPTLVYSPLITTKNPAALQRNYPKGQLVRPSVCLSACPSVRPSIGLSVCLSVRLSVCLSVSLSDSSFALMSIRAAYLHWIFSLFFFFEKRAGGE